MTVPVIQVDNIGTVFRFTVLDQDGAIVDLSSNTLLEVIFKTSPEVAGFVRTGVLTTDGTDGKFEYVTIAGDLSVAGELWQRQGKVIVPLGTFWTNVVQFPVKPNLV